MDDLYGSFETIAGPALWLTYEDHVEGDPLVAYQLVQEHLGFPGHRPTVRLSRTNPEPLSELLANLPEVQSYLAGTPYAWMADE